MDKLRDRYDATRFAFYSPEEVQALVAGHNGGWRLDHTFVAAALLLRACQYHHEWRERGLSDHSALETDLEQRGKSRRNQQIM